MSFLGLMTVRAHEAVVAELRADRDSIHKSYGAKHDALLRALQELSFQKGQVANLSRRKDEETVRADLSEQRVVSLLDTIDALTPDAQKWRDRKQADRDYRAGKRAKANV